MQDDGLEIVGVRREKVQDAPSHARNAQSSQKCWPDDGGRDEAELFAKDSETSPNQIAQGKRDVGWRVIQSCIPILCQV